jgi:hypothetical protein
MFTASRVIELVSPRGSKILSEKSCLIPASVICGSDACARANQPHRLAVKVATARNTFVDELALITWDWALILFTDGA